MAAHLGITWNWNSNLAQKLQELSQKFRETQKQQLYEIQSREGGSHALNKYIEKEEKMSAMNVDMVGCHGSPGESMSS